MVNDMTLLISSLQVRWSVQEDYVGQHDYTEQCVAFIPVETEEIMSFSIDRISFVSRGGI